MTSDCESFPANEQVAFEFARRLTIETLSLGAASRHGCRQAAIELQILMMPLAVGGVEGFA